MSDVRSRRSPVKLEPRSTFATGSVTQKAADPSGVKTSLPSHVSGSKHQPRVPATASPPGTSGGSIVSKARSSLRGPVLPVMLRPW